MKRNKTKLLTVLCIICVLILKTSIAGMYNDDIFVVKNLGGGDIGDYNRMYSFTSQSGEPLPVFEYKDSVYVPIRSFCKYVNKGIEWSPSGIRVFELPANKYEGECWGKEEDYDDYPIVSMIELIANSEKYDGKNISVSGVINVGYESDLLFLTKEDYNYCITENSLRWHWYNFDFHFDAKDLTEFYEKMGDISGVHVEMQGTFKKSDVSSDGFGSRGYLMNIKCIRCHEITT